MRTCPKCRATIPSHASFCARCGAEVVEQTVQDKPLSCQPEQLPRESTVAAPDATYQCTDCRGHFARVTFPRYECTKCGGDLCKSCRKVNELCPNCRKSSEAGGMIALIVIGVLMFVVFRLVCS